MCKIGYFNWKHSSSIDIVRTKFDPQEIVLKLVLKPLKIHSLVKLDEWKISSRNLGTNRKHICTDCTRYNDRERDARREGGRLKGTLRIVVS